jgi:hypothetical protein
VINCRHGEGLYGAINRLSLARDHSTPPLLALPWRYSVQYIRAVMDILELHLVRHSLGWVLGLHLTIAVYNTPIA